VNKEARAIGAMEEGWKTRKANGILVTQ